MGRNKKEVIYHFYAMNSKEEYVNIKTLPLEEQIRIGQYLNDVGLKAAGYLPMEEIGGEEWQIMGLHI